MPPHPPQHRPGFCIPDIRQRAFDLDFESVSHSLILLFCHADPARRGLCFDFLKGLFQFLPGIPHRGDHIVMVAQRRIVFADVRSHYHALANALNAAGKRDGAEWDRVAH
jgi:hypothetical protein